MYIDVYKEKEMKNECCKTKKDEDNLELTAEFLKVVAEKNRLKILCLLQKEELCVCQIWEKLDISQNLASHHLKVLKDFELLKKRREGVKIIYSLNKKEVNKYYKLLSHYLGGATLK
ncbi:MAG: ArsR/SmtB family transcription factor [Patescibacteria group bacterium]